MEVGVGRMTDREKLVKLVKLARLEADLRCDESQCTGCLNEKDCTEGFVSDYLIANGVTFATDTNVGSEWISVEDYKPDEFVSVLGHMTDAGDFPPVRECYKVGNVFFFPALQDIHPIDKWAYMPEPPEEVER